MRVAPLHDVVEVVTPGEGATHPQQQNFRQGWATPRLAGVGNEREVIQQALQAKAFSNAASMMVSSSPPNHEIVNPLIAINPSSEPCALRVCA